jgi:hypothetical protein
MNAGLVDQMCGGAENIGGKEETVENHRPPPESDTSKRNRVL